MEKPLAIDLCSGLGGWAEGLEAEGWHVRRYDICDMFEETGAPKPDGIDLVLRDVLTLHGSEVADANLIVASPPCQAYSWMAMPWGRAKQAARALRGEDVFPEPYRGPRSIAELNALFNACFRIQREANQARATRDLPPIPMVVENVKGAQPWVGRAAWSFGSYYLWGDVPALMPNVIKRVPEATNRPGRTMCYPAGSQNPDAVRGRTGKLHWQDEPNEGRKNPGFRFDGSGRSFQSESVERHVLEGTKNTGGSWFNIGSPGQKVTGQNPAHAIAREIAEGHKHKDIDGYERNHPNAFGWKIPATSSKSSARKAASAKIAKIPFALSSWVARCYRP